MNEWIQNDFSISNQIYATIYGRRCVICNTTISYQSDVPQGYPFLLKITYGILPLPEGVTITKSIRIHTDIRRITKKYNTMVLEYQYVYTAKLYHERYRENRYDNVTTLKHVIDSWTKTLVASQLIIIWIPKNALSIKPILLINRDRKIWMTELLHNVSCSKCYFFAGVVEERRKSIANVFLILTHQYIRVIQGPWCTNMCSRTNLVLIVCDP